MTLRLTAHQAAKLAARTGQTIPVRAARPRPLTPQGRVHPVVRGPWPNIAADGVSLALLFPAPGRAMSANDRGDRWSRSSEIAMWRSTTAMFARRSRGIGDRVFVTVLVPSQARDASNLAPTSKAVTDGLTDAGWWVDDSTELVHQMQPVVLPHTVTVVAVAVTPMGAGIDTAFRFAAMVASTIV